MATKQAAKATTKKTATKSTSLAKAANPNGLNSAKETNRAPATKAAKPIDKVSGVTEMTREKHNYEGYSVRAQKGGNNFRRYVSASEKTRPEKTDLLRKKAAHAEAAQLVGSLKEILDDKKSWDKEGNIRPGALKSAKALGFKHEIPAPRKARESAPA